MANLNTHFEFFDSLFSYAFALFCIAGTLSLHFQTTPVPNPQNIRRIRAKRTAK